MEISKKQIKKEMNHLGLALVGYMLLQFIGAFVYMLVSFIHYAIVNPDKVDTMTDQESQAIFDAMFQSGWMYFVSIAFAFIAIILYRKKQLFTEDLIRTNKRMNQKVFVEALVYMLGVQFLFTILGTGLEYIFNQFGYSLTESIEEASAQSMTVSMFVYAGVIGPLVEEIIFRGAVLRSMEKYGKLFAIIVSAILFGAFHGNLVQGIFAFFVGIALGYIAIEYSIKWSILLHMMNNIFADVINGATSGLPDEMGEIIAISIFLFGFLATLLLLYLRRSEIRKFIEQNRTKRCYYRYFFSRIFIILVFLLGIVLSFMGVTKL